MDFTWTDSKRVTTTIQRWAVHLITGSDRLLRGLLCWYKMGAKLGFQERNGDINVIFYGGLEHVIDKFPNT
jgi:hypothetical protein